MRISRQVRILSCAALVAAAGLAGADSAAATSLRGTSGSLDRQNRQAQLHRLRRLDTRRQLLASVESGALVRVEATRDLILKEVSFPFARPEVKLFVERLARSYRTVCGEELVVTSLTRPRFLQPPNASWRSVHPMGIAFDLRRSWSRRCRGWLEGVLLTLEHEGVLEATLEWRPPHYHVALFPDPYRDLLRRLAQTPGESEFRVIRYQVSRGDTLAKIARRHRTTVDQVKRSNGLRSDLIHPGQVLVLPGAR